MVIHVPILKQKVYNLLHCLHFFNVVLIQFNIHFSRNILTAQFHRTHAY